MIDLKGEAAERVYEALANLINLVLVLMFSLCGDRDGGSSVRRQARDQEIPPHSHS